MTSPGSFVSRWARLKRDSGIQQGTEPAVDGSWADAVTEIPAPGTETALAQTETAVAADAPFDPASLPSIDAIDLNTDIRGFLQSRVPAELTRAALRQAWTSDPAIRDFIGIAENQWDFNDPEGIPGFGPLPDGYDVSGLLSKALGGHDRLAGAIPEISTSIQQSPPNVAGCEPANPDLAVLPSTAGENLPDGRSRENAPPEYDPAAETNDRPPNHRRHGSALPRQDG
jgi:hypothetical protein